MNAGLTFDEYREVLRLSSSAATLLLVMLGKKAVSQERNILVWVGQDPYQ